MNEQEFWEIIAESLKHCPPGSDEQYEWMTQRLMTFDEEQIIDFDHHLRVLKIKACTFPVLMANFIIQSYVSDDVFEDFRVWLIAQGKKHFYAAIEHPDSIAAFCHVDDPIKEINGEGMLFVAENAYQRKTQKDDFFDRVDIQREPDIEENWPEQSKGFQRIMPRLFERYWNPEQIKEFLSVSERN